MAGTGKTDEAINREIDALMARPELASVKGLTDRLVACILQDIGAPPGLDRHALMRMCATTVVLAEQEGIRRQRALTDVQSARIDALSRTIATQRAHLATQAELADRLGVVVADQGRTIAEQARLVELLDESAGLRALRLPH